MTAIRMLSAAALAALLALAGCATRPINPPLPHADPAKGYRLDTRAPNLRDREDMVVLAFSGGGTRAAAFSYGVLEALRGTEVVDRKGERTRLLDSVSVITGVSGGSFTALAYGFHGERLFSDYERRFLKRDIQGELIGRALNPLYWGALSSPGWGRSELAADVYDEILFDGATFADLQRGPGPLIVASATDLSAGTRFPFTQGLFDAMCSDLSGVRLSRAAAASSGVPVVLSPVTLNNYGGRCGYVEPPLLKYIAGHAIVVRPAARALQELGRLRSYEDGKARPYVHLVDGGLSDNLGMRAVLDMMDELEALHLAGQKTPLDRLRRLVVLVVNSLSVPDNDWDKSPTAPGTLDILLKATGVPIDRYSHEAVELLRDTAMRWKMLRHVRDSGVITDKDNANPALVEVTRVPDLEVYVVDVSFAQLKDAAEREYLNQLPTTFVLPGAAVDRLRAAAATLVLGSPEFRRYLNDMGERIVKQPLRAGASP